MPESPVGHIEFGPDSFCELDREKACRLLQRLDNLTPKPKRAYNKNPELEKWTLLSDESLFGRNKIPADLANVVSEAINKLIARGDVPAGARFQALELWAGNTLAEPDNAC